MLAATIVVGIDVSRDWLNGFCLPGLQRFRLANSPEGHEELISMICQMSAPLHVGLDGHEDQISDLEQRIGCAVASEQTSATKAGPLRSIPGIRPVSAATLVAEMPELGRMTAGKATAMAGLAPVPHDSWAMRGRRAIAGGGRRALRQVLYQAALAAACHNPVLKPLAKRLSGRGKPHKVVIIAIARRLTTIANAILKTGEIWRPQAS